MPFASKSPVIRDDNDDRYCKSFSAKAFLDVESAEEVKNAQNFLGEYGYVVINDVYSLEECARTVAEMVDLFEEANADTDGFDRSIPSTWAKFPSQGIPAYGSVQRAPFFTPQTVANRANIRLIEILRALMGVTDPLISFDRGAVQRPTTITPGGKKLRTRDNVHIDLNPWQFMGDKKHVTAALEQIDYTSSWITENNIVSPDQHPLQIVVNLLDNHEADGGFVCVPRFHLEFEEYFSQMEAKLEQVSYSFRKSDSVYLRAFRIPMRAGSIVLWNETLPHGSFGNRSTRPRAAQFMRAFSRSSATNTRLVRRATALREELLKNNLSVDVADNVVEEEKVTYAYESGVEEPDVVAMAATVERRPFMMTKRAQEVFGLDVLPE